MAAQSYEQPYEPARRAPERRGPAGPPPATAATGMPAEPGTRVSGRREGRRRSEQETMISEAPRRARGRGSGGDGGPGGPGEPPGRSGGDRPAWRRFLPSWKIVVAGVVVFSAGIFGMIAVAYANMPVPTADQAQDSVDDQGSVIYFDNKKELARLGVKRTPVKIGQVPKHVQDAVVAAENGSFWEDAGISFSGMVRSVYSTVSGQQVQGASTITQQMARNYYDGLSQERTVERKIKEILVAVKLNKQLDKNTILEQYLNTIYFGRGANGIGAAAEAFFGKKVAELTPEEGAYLAGRIQNPDAFDRAELRGDLGPTEFRYDYVLREMAKLDPAKYGNLGSKSPTAPKRKKPNDKDYFTGLRGYMVQAVLDELKSRGINREDVDKNGYRIYTSFNWRLMKAAKAAVDQHTRSMSPEIQVSLAAVDPRNGRIRAFYGGDDYAKDSWNDAFQSQKQAASAFKPYVLAAWLDSGYSLRSYLPAKGPVKLDGTTPIDNDHASRSSSVDVVTATADSINTAFAKMGEKVTLDKVIEIASRAGLSKERLEYTRDNQHYLLTIGSSEVTAVEQAGGYSIFANGGRHIHNHVIVEVRDRNKKLKLPEIRTAAKVISAEAAADATTALQAVVKQGTGRNAALYDRPVAGKTGTNNNNKEAWFVGFTPQLSTAVGMYRKECVVPKSGKVVTPVYDGCPWWRGKDPDKEKKYTPQKPYSQEREKPLGDGFQGGSYSAAIWRTFMTEAMKGEKVEQFPPRADTGVPENLAPKPMPTPTATKEPDEALPDDVTCAMDPCDEDNGRIISIDPNENNGFDEDNGLLGGGQDPGMPPYYEQPETMPTGREQW
ncbi:penicillin-binding protein [Nonomuraea sp. RK-328]|nr:penicillin-binding protein [Nonomuraea sp. RK-328]